MSETNLESRVIVFAPVANDANAMAGMLRQNGVSAVIAGSAPQCRTLMEGGAGALLLTEEALRELRAERTMELLRRQPPWSELPLLILTSGRAARLADLLESTAAAAGSITLLQRPVASALLLRSVRVALSARARQYQVRQLLADQAARQQELETAKTTLERELQRRREAEAALGKWAEQDSEPERFPRWVRYAGAAAALIFAVAVRQAFQAEVQNRLPFVTLFGTVAITVWFAGFWPAVGVALLGYVGCAWLFVPHAELLTATDVYAFVLYAVGIALILAIGLAMRRAHAQARANARMAIERQRHAERALAERDRAEARARELDERLRVAVKNSRFVLAQCDADLRYRWIHNPHPDFPQAIGRRDDELDRGRGALELMALKRRVLDFGQGATGDITIEGPTEARSYAVVAEPLRDAAGRVVGVTTAALDVTDRKRAEDALRESEARARAQAVELEAVYESSPLGLSVLDTDLRFRRINRRLAELNGRSVAEHIGRRVEEIVPGVAEQAAAALRQVLATGQAVRVELRGATPSVPGEERIWDEHWAPLRNDKGEIVGCVVVVEEVTARRRYEEAVRESEERFRAMADNVPQLVWMARPDGRVFWFNRRWYEFTGATPEEMGREEQLDALMHPQHRDRVRHGFMAAVAQDRPWEETHPILGKDGRYRWFLSRAVPIKDADGRTTLWFGTNTEITVLRETQDALREAQRQVRQYAAGLEQTVAERTARLQETVQELEAFSYSIAHDMRAPLRSMIGYADILNEEHGGNLDDTARDYLRRITVSARRLDRLIQDVLNYSRIVREELPLEPVDAGQLVREVVEGYPNLAAARAAIAIDPGLPAVLGNRAALGQVYSNLLDNALKFVPPGVTPAVRVYAEPGAAPRADGRGEWVRLCVEGNGIGVDPKVRARMFQMFQRFTRAGLYEGNGMGLAIARKAVDRMGGVIGVEPAAERGTRFWFILPMAPATPAAEWE
ncbi:PAS domain-containing protein [Opitutus sp. ER46]|uniref:PAS domain-containing protein n=1 Tax=Opitutus sp. ER46 TaxID=2161864 RepID=UPI000D3074DD|nr:PAS domain-containing protein [Opitutus sp. ER46]PTY01086.1 hypothetical protein DB354_00700 [Opitutus sp. ER46]